MHQMIKNFRFSDSGVIHDSWKLSRWIFECVKPYLHGKIIEIGSGKGVFSDFFIRNEIGLRLSDPNAGNCFFLEKKYGGNDLVKGVHQIDVNNVHFETEYKSFLGRFDTVLAISAPEDVLVNNGMIGKISLLLRRGGYLIVSSWVDTVLFGGLEEGARFWWEQNRKDIKKRLTAEFEIRHLQYMQIAGAGAPYSAKTHFSDNLIYVRPLTLFEKMVPTFRVVDDSFCQHIGYSTLVIAKRKLFMNSNKSVL